MKTTIEMPDDLFREAKATAARRGVALRRFVEDAVSEKLAREQFISSLGKNGKQWPVPPPDVPLEELERIEAIIEGAFETVDADE
ncbi:MAG: hypothetical protein WD904_12625 [Dehalococcoidia bacterium]